MSTTTAAPRPCPVCGHPLLWVDYCDACAHRETEAEAAPADPTGPCPDCGRRMGWDGHRYGPCAADRAARRFAVALDRAHADLDARGVAR